MRQVPESYSEAKAACPDAILLLRIGDFYEIFGDDAKIVASLLGLTITRSSKGQDSVAMCGFPYHSLHAYRDKLIAAGKTVVVKDSSGK